MKVSSRSTCFSGVLLLSLALLLAICTPFGHARSLFDTSKPLECDVDTGHWKPTGINCDFNCGVDGWEVDCDCKPKDSCKAIRCKVYKDGAPDSEDIIFQCTSEANGKVSCLFSEDLNKVAPAQTIHSNFILLFPCRLQHATTVP